MEISRLTTSAQASLHKSSLRALTASGITAQHLEYSTSRGFSQFGSKQLSATQSQKTSKNNLIYYKCSSGSGEHTQLRIHLQRQHLGKSTGWCEERADLLGKSFLGHVFLLKTKVCFNIPERRISQSACCGTRVPGCLCQAALSHLSFPCCRV